MDNIVICLNDFLKRKYPNINLKYDIRENKDKSKGDFYSTIAFNLTSYINKTPYEIGLLVKEDIKDRLKDYNIEVAKTGHVNFFLKKDGYIDIFNKIKQINTEENNIEIFNADNFNIKKIKYIHDRIITILNILKLDNIHVDLEKFSEHNIELEDKNILDKLVESFHALNKDNKEDLLTSIIDLSNSLYKYEENIIIKYLPTNRLENLIIILYCISILIRYAIQKF